MAMTVTVSYVAIVLNVAFAFLWKVLFLLSVTAFL